jgi:predicted small lipoprotein YifL
MANHSLFKLSVVALLVSTLAACGKTEDAPAAQPGSAPVAAASAAAASALPWITAPSWQPRLLNTSNMSAASWKAC